MSIYNDQTNVELFAQPISDDDYLWVASFPLDNLLELFAAPSEWVYSLNFNQNAPDWLIELSENFVFDIRLADDLGEGVDVLVQGISGTGSLTVRVSRHLSNPPIGRWLEVLGVSSLDEFWSSFDDRPRQITALHSSNRAFGHLELSRSGDGLVKKGATIALFLYEVVRDTSKLSTVFESQQEVANYTTVNGQPEPISGPTQVSFATANLTLLYSGQTGSADEACEVLEGTFTVSPTDPCHAGSIVDTGTTKNYVVPVPPPIPPEIAQRRQKRTA